MSDANAEITGDLLDASVAEAAPREAAILQTADALLVAGSHTLAEALAAGFRAHVPLAGGSIGAAIEAAVASLDVEAENALKVGFDAVIADAKAKAAAA